MRHAKSAGPSASSSARGASAGEPALWLPQPDVDAIKAYFKGITLKDVMQLRLPLFLTGETVRTRGEGKTRVCRARGMKFGDRREEVRLLKVLLTQATLAVVLGRFGFSYAWLVRAPRPVWMAVPYHCAPCVQHALSQQATLTCLPEPFSPFRAHNGPAVDNDAVHLVALHLVPNTAY
jgi:hypothetical protein